LEGFEKLLGADHKGKELEVDILPPVRIRVAKARVEDPNDTRSPEDRLNDQVTPLWRLSYVPLFFFSV
jgi:hypothetical protein